MKKIFFLCCVLFSSSLYSQVGGESVFQFLNLTSSSRQVALGGEALTLINDVNQPIWNPSVIKLETGTFKASDVAISFGYAVNLPWTNIYMGLNGKFINSRISNFTSNGIASDIAILYYSPYKSYAFTIVARNMGTQIKSYDGTIEKLPFKVWHFTLDNLQQWKLATPNPSNSTSDLEGNITDEKISFLTNAFRHFVVGAELFPDSPINLRAGYNFRRSSELKLQNARSFSGISFGFGIKMNRLRFNYAFSKYHAATSASTFSLQFDLDKR